MQEIDLSAMTIPERDALRTQVNETLTAKVEAEEASIQERLASLAAIKGGKKTSAKPSSSACTAARRMASGPALRPI